MIVDNQTKMLNSLLNRYKDKIVVDRIIHTNTITGDESLLVQLDDILLNVNKQFIELQNKCNHSFDNNMLDD